MRGWVRLIEVVPVLVFCLMPLGCGKGYQVAPVSGRITLDGEPASNAQVSFLPVADQKLPLSIARTDEEGKYSLQFLQQDVGPGGAVVGEHRVMISPDPQKTKATDAPAPKAANRDRTPASKLVPGSVVNGKFIEACIVPPEGKTDANFDLKSK
jgi:hypothetical protein